MQYPLNEGVSLPPAPDHLISPRVLVDAKEMPIMLGEITELPM